MFDAIGFDPKTLSNEQLLDRQIDLVSKKLIAARYGKADIVNQLHLMIQMIERERLERIFDERIGSVLRNSSPIAVESDPDLSEKQHSMEEEKKQQAKPAPSRAYAKPLRSHVPIRSK